MNKCPCCGTYIEDGTDTTEQYFPDGWGWSKLMGYYYAYGDKLYWMDGDVTDNRWPKTCFTGKHGMVPLDGGLRLPPKLVTEMHGKEK